MIVILVLQAGQIFNNIIEELINENSAEFDFSNRKTIFKSLHHLHQILKDEYFINPSENDDQPVESSQVDGVILSEEGIFEFCSYRSVDEYSQYWAVGSGRRYALGAMHNAYSEKTAEEIAIAGVEAGSCFDDGSGLPIQHKTIKLKKYNKANPHGKI